MNIKELEDQSRDISVRLANITSALLIVAASEYSSDESVNVSDIAATCRVIAEYSQKTSDLHNALEIERRKKA